MLRLVLLTLMLLTIPSLAFADPVPMCGELAQSIEAPPPIYPGREATLGEVQCATQRSHTSYNDVSSLPTQLDDSRSVERPLGYYIGQRLPRVLRIRVPVPRPEPLSLPAGERRQVERPPRHMS